MKTQIKIKYCVPCGYLPTAQKFQEVLEEKSAEVELIEGDRGVFNVWINGKLIFSKHQEGRFPEISEIVEKLS